MTIDWIPVTEALPARDPKNGRHSIRVICYDPKGDGWQSFGRLVFKTMRWETDLTITTNVTHWAKSPLPPMIVFRRYTTPTP